MNPRLLVMPLVVVGALACNAAAQTPPANPAPKDPNAEALRILRATIAEQTKNPDKVIRTPDDDLPVSKPAPVTPRNAAAAELEQRYLAGKISQREYEKELARLTAPGPASTNAPASRTSAKKTSTAPKATSPRDSSGPPPAIEPAFTAPPPQSTERQKKISEVEGRLDDMIRAKEARERAAQTNAPTAAPGQKLSKRERLDFLLRQVVQGKLSDEEYKKERERIMAEPD